MKLATMLNVDLNKNKIEWKKRKRCSKQKHTLSFKFGLETEICPPENGMKVITVSLAKEKRKIRNEKDRKKRLKTGKIERKERKERKDWNENIENGMRQRKDGKRNEQRQESEWRKRQRTESEEDRRKDRK